MKKKNAKIVRKGPIEEQVEAPFEIKKGLILHAK